MTDKELLTISELETRVKAIAKEFCNMAVLLEEIRRDEQKERHNNDKTGNY